MLNILKRILRVSKQEKAAREEIKTLGEKILAEPCSKQTGKLKQKAKAGAREVLNGL